MIVKKMTVMNAMLNRAVNIAAEELDFDGSWLNFFVPWNKAEREKKNIPFNLYINRKLFYVSYLLQEIPREWDYILH